jgi:hypothetical protein
MSVRRGIPPVVAVTLVAALVVGAGGTGAPDRGHGGTPASTFFGQSPPGKTAQLFAPTVLVGEAHDSPVISPDGQWFFLHGMDADVLFYGMVDGELAAIDSPLSVEFPQVCNGMTISPSGDRLYVEEWRDGRDHIKYADRQSEGWTSFTDVDLGIEGSPWQMSVASDGDVYVSSGGIVVRVPEGESLSGPVPLRLEDGRQMAGDTPSVSLDEDVLLCSIEGDLHISYRRDDGAWTVPLDLGPEVNSEQLDLCPQLTPGGEYLVFVSRRLSSDFRVFWTDAGFVEALRPGGLD